MSLQFPLDSLNLSRLLNRVNSSGISLVEINGYICTRRKIGKKKKKDHRYIEVTPASANNEKSSNFFRDSYFPIIIGEEYCQHSASHSK